MTEIEELRQEFAEFKAMLLTADQYLRYERLPQLVGGNVTHFAGSEEVAVVGDRWEYMDPGLTAASQGNGYTSFDIATLSPPTAQDVVDATEEGKIMALGVVCDYSNYAGWGGGEAIVADLRITIDGGTPTLLPLSTSGQAEWHKWTWAWRTNGTTTTGDWGNKPGDAFAIPLNFEYKTSIKIEVLVTSASNFLGDTLGWSCYVHRARLKSA